MTLNDYQQQAVVFAKYAYPDYPFLALSEEVGEVMGKLAKHSRKYDASLRDTLMHAATPVYEHEIFLRDDLIKELGDVLWQLQACCGELNVTLEEVAQSNLDKLSGRADRGTIVGEGDSR